VYSSSQHAQAPLLNGCALAPCQITCNSDSGTHLAPPAPPCCCPLGVLTDGDAAMASALWRSAAGRGLWPTNHACAASSRVWCPAGVDSASTCCRTLRRTEKNAVWRGGMRVGLCSCCCCCLHFPPFSLQGVNRVHGCVSTRGHIAGQWGCSHARHVCL
jgi:hypothetical protein